jgi:alginate O-acetyltransferase complex protein AlgI
MVFSSPLFVFQFLPIVLGVYFLLGRSLRNTWLLAASLLFYAWGEPVIVLIMLVSIAANWGFGWWVDTAREKGGGRGVIALAAVFNIGLLVFFKYADWMWAGLGELLHAVGLASSVWPTIASSFPADSWLRDVIVDAHGKIRLPIGISFFTFQAFSYVIDVYRREGRLQKNPFDIALYVAFFPQLIAGPIVRYRDVAQQIVHRVVTLDGFAYGIRRFVIGLGKKVLIANVCAECADHIFGTAAAGTGIPVDQLTTPVAWLGIVAYTLQIYFDFSGYSDMAIGLGWMLGFKFLENFDYPYIARSITEFWRRWHMSLSSWFRDYLYIPLGGNRHGPARTYTNLVLVFFLCGLWHGANLTFLVWGLYHGGFLVIERLGWKRFLDERAGVLRHVYTILVVMVGWVFFRAEDIGQAWVFLGTMFGVQTGSQMVHVGTDLVVAANQLHHIDLYASSLTWFALACGVIGSTPWLPRLVAWHRTLEPSGRVVLANALQASALLGLAVVFVRAAMDLAAGAYNPFIYFRF